MLTQITSLWTAGQIALSVVIVACCMLLAVFRPRTPRQQPDPQIERDRDETTRPKHAEDRPRQMALAAKVTLTVVLVAVAVFLVERSDDPVGVRTDSWSEANVLISGRSYAREGLMSHYGAAQHQVVTDQNPPDPFFLYNRYPVGSNLINALWQIAGVRSIPVFRLLPAACSLAAVILWFGLYRRIAGQTVAVVAAVVLALSYGFLAYADNLHFHAYALLTSVAAMRSYLRAMAPNQQRRLRWFLLTALFMFITAWFTWEYHLWMVLFIAVYAMLFKCPVRRPYLALLAVPLFAALAMQTAQRRLSFADVRIEAADDNREEGGFLDDVYRRTLGFEVAVDTPHGLTLAGYPEFLLLRYYKFYGLPAVAALAMLIMLLMRDRRAPWKVHDWPDGPKLVAVLLIAGIGWWVVMMQHTAVHPHVMRHALAGYALLMALVWVRCWNTTRSPAFHPLARAAAALLMLVLCYPQIEGLICDLRVHYQDNFTDNRERGTAGVAESRQFSPLQRVVPQGAVILTNHNRLPLMRLWSQRPVYSGAFYPFPRDDPENARMIMELRFNHLRELYHESLPPLYYVYRVLANSPDAAFDADPFLRFFLLASTKAGDQARNRARPIIIEGWTKGRCDRSHCPIVARIGNMLVFKLDPAVPVFRREWGPAGLPTLRQFGPPR